MNELYRELKQYIHNELKITKDEIKVMIREAIKTELEAVLKDENNYNKFIGNQLNQYIKENSEAYKEPYFTAFKPKCLDQVVYDAVIKEINEVVKDRVIISLSEK